MDGNMLNNGCFKYDSANRLIETGDLKYTYNSEDVRIRSFGEYVDTTYTYNTNCKLSQLLTKTTNGITTKYVYGLGLIGEEKEGCFKTYHFDYRGSTVAITDECGNIIDTLKYDTYGNVTEHIGDSYVIFGYNGRDGVVTDRNGLLYMRARYYSPAMRRFVNADILHGEISDSTSLNRYSYVNGNPVSFVDPFGLWSLKSAFKSATNWVKKNADKIVKVAATVAVVTTLAVVTVATAGTATAVIAGGALVGSAVGGTVGAAVGYATGGIDGAINGMLVGTISGAASGAIGASGMSATAVAVSNAAVNVVETVFEDVIEDGKLNNTDFVDVAFAVGSGMYGSKAGLQYSKHSSYFTNRIYSSKWNKDMLDYSYKLVKSEIDGTLMDESYGTARDTYESITNNSRCK